MPTPITPAATSAPFRFIDADGYCLSARLLPDLNTSRPTTTMSITIEGSDEPQSVHVPVVDLPQVLAGIAAAGGVAVAPQPAPADRAAEVADLQAELEKLVRWHKEDGNQAVKAAATITRLRAERAELGRQLDCARGDVRDMEAHVREQDAEFERIRADRAAILPETADRADATDLTESPENAARRFARRVSAVERLCAGRPGYHTVTVKELLTAMSDAADEPLL